MSTCVNALIDLSALRHNLARVCVFAPNSRICAMVKANAYGHGLVRVAQALDRADEFGVTRLEEALALRDAGIQLPILVMDGFRDEHDVQVMSRLELTPVVYQWDQVQMLERLSLEKPLSVWLYLDTGMHRLGLSADEMPLAYEALSRSNAVRPPFGFMTHFSDAGDKNHPKTLAQQRLFETTIVWPGVRSLANSPALVAWPETQMDWVRPGILLYGASPFPDQTGSDLGLRPVMTLSTTLTSICPVQPGETVGYGDTWVCSEPTRIGVAAIGYGDGYPRRTRNGAPVLVGGVMCTLAGRVSMDLITIDLRAHPQARIGDPVVLWGEGLPAEKLAAYADTIPYELFCQITQRVHVHYIG